MLGKTHVVLGIIASSWMISTNDIKTGLVVVGASIVGSLMPDIDHGESTLRRIITFMAKSYEEVIAIAVAAGFIYELFKSPFDGMSIAAIAVMAAAAVYTIIKNEHRGFSHSLAAICLYGFCMFVLLYPAFLPLWTCRK